MKFKSINRIVLYPWIMLSMKRMPEIIHHMSSMAILEIIWVFANQLHQQMLCRLAISCHKKWSHAASQQLIWCFICRCQEDRIVIESPDCPKERCVRLKEHRPCFALQILQLSRSTPGPIFQSTNRQADIEGSILALRSSQLINKDSIRLCTNKSANH